MNLSKAQQYIPDVTRAARAGTAIGNETANQLRAFSALGQQMREGNARIEMAQADQAMNLRERQQRMSQSANLHPYQILQAQEAVQSSMLNNERMAQQIRTNEIMFPLKIEEQLVRNEEAEQDAIKATMDLNDRRETNLQRGSFEDYRRKLVNWDSLPDDVKAETPVPMPETEFTGATATTVAGLISSANAEKRRATSTTAESKLEDIKEQRLMELASEGYGDLATMKANPGEVLVAANRRAEAQASRIMSSYRDANGNEFSQGVIMDYARRYQNTQGDLDVQSLVANLNRNAKLIEGASRGPMRSDELIKETNKLAKDIYDGDRSDEGITYAEAVQQARQIMADYSPSERNLSGLDQAFRGAPAPSAPGTQQPKTGQKEITAVDKEAIAGMIETHAGGTGVGTSLLGANPVGLYMASKHPSRKWRKTLKDKGLSVKKSPLEPREAKDRKVGEIYWKDFEVKGEGYQTGAWMYNSQSDIDNNVRQWVYQSEIK